MPTHLQPPSYFFLGTRPVPVGAGAGVVLPAGTASPSVGGLAVRLGLAAGRLLAAGADSAARVGYAAGVVLAAGADATTEVGMAAVDASAGAGADDDASLGAGAGSFAGQTRAAGQRPPSPPPASMWGWAWCRRYAMRERAFVCVYLRALKKSIGSGNVVRGGTGGG